MLRPVSGVKVVPLLTRPAPRSRFAPLAVCLLSLGAGLALGLLAVGLLPARQRRPLEAELGAAVRGLGVGRVGVRPTTVFAESLVELEHVAAVLWLGGLSPWGGLAAVAALFLRGFALGFGVGAFTVHWGRAGLLLALLATGPGNLLSLPVLIALGACATGRSWGMWRSWRAGRRPPPLGGYALAGVLAAVALVPSGLTTGFLVPELLRWTSPWWGS